MTASISFYKSNLNLFLIAAIFVGAALGYFFPVQFSVIELLGNLFLSSLKMLIVPVIFVSLLAGILNIDQESSLARIGVKTLIFYGITTGIAVALGLVLVNIVGPGITDSPLPMPESAVSDQKEGGIVAVITNIIPPNIVQAAVAGNVLGIIFFTIFFGIALRSVAHNGFKTVQLVTDTVFAALIWMVDVVMLVAPIGVLALIWSLVADAVSQNMLGEVGGQIGKYALTVLVGLFIHGAISLPLILFFFKINPIKFFKAMLPAISTAFSTASSAATLPITIDSLRTRARVPDRYASFVAPLGATVNMDGTAIYESIAAIFIANMYGIHLDLSQQLVIFLTATFSAIGAAGIPGAGLIMMTMVLGSVGVPVEGISLIVAIDRFLDMFRTCINVWGDSIGAAVISVSEGHQVMEE